ncbi:MAG: response regulator [Halanaerobiales bacterium]
MSKILIVDDAKNIVMVLKKCLENSGYETEVAKDGIIALQKAQEVDPDLILLDILLPKMNGFLVYEALKDDPKTENIPVVFISAKAEEKDFNKAMSLGAEEYLVKPIKPDELIKTVEKVLKEES